MSPFFGLTPEYKLGMHEEIFAVCYAGKGGFIWSDVYNMPVHLRKFYIKLISDAIDRENKEYEKMSGDKKISSPNVSNGSNFRR